MAEAMLNDPLVLVAFDGWNDACSVASRVITHLGAHLGADAFGILPADDYTDYQQSRPNLVRTPAGELLNWPQVTVSVAPGRERDLVLISGPEPNLHWPRFAAVVCEFIINLDPQLVVLLGAMLSDVPHTRPVPLVSSFSDQELADRFILERNDYEGPIGMTGLVTRGLISSDIPTISIWAGVPHYTASQPNAKAELAVLSKLEDILRTDLELGSLPDDAEAWEHSVDELMASDESARAYLDSLEQQFDAEGGLGASGDSLAAEFQRYFRRRNSS
ncbi:MAG: carboxylate--amine ligase [Propionibacterium sp.]|nr:MAG: carboxylate--amine ligase [Propionibacterium sp.]